MDRTKIQRILEVANKEEKEKITTLYNATVNTMKSYELDNSASKLKDWQAAETWLNNAAAVLENKYFPATENTFKNLFEVAMWLEKEGYKVKKSKVYVDAKKGLVAVQSDKSVRYDDVIAYAARENLERIGNTEENSEGLHAREKLLQIQKLERQNEEIEFRLNKEKGLYIKKSDVRTEVALKIATLEAGIKHLFRTKIFEWLSVCGADLKKAHMVLDLIYSELDELLDEMGTIEEIGVVVKKNVELCTNDLETCAAATGGSTIINEVRTN